MDLEDVASTVVDSKIREDACFEESFGYVSALAGQMKLYSGLLGVERVRGRFSHCLGVWGHGLATLLSASGRKRYIDLWLAWTKIK